MQEKKVQKRYNEEFKGQAVDALTAFLADRMLKVGGYLDFDDYDWTFCASPSCNPRVFPLTGKLYTAEQIESKQVKMIVDLLIRRDPRYQEVVANKIFPVARRRFGSKKYYPLSLNWLARCRAEFWYDDPAEKNFIDTVR